MMFYISTKFHENSLKDFRVTERTRLRDGRTDGLAIDAKQYVFTPVRGRYNKNIKVLIILTLITSNLELC